MEFALLVKTFGAFFAIMNPFVNLPIFLSLTNGYSVQEQRGLAIKIAVFSFVMCAVILLAGQQIIEFFGITVDEFRIAGGLVLGHIAWNKRVPLTQSKMLKQKLDQHGVINQLFVEDGAGHSDPVFDSKKYVPHVIQFIKQHLPNE